MNAAQHPPALAERALAELLPRLGEIDRELLRAQRFLDRTTYDTLYGEPPVTDERTDGMPPAIVEASQRLAGEARPGLATAVALTKAVSRRAERPYDGSDRASTAVLESGEATTIERARLLAALCRARGLAARLCLLYRDGQPNVHAVCEIGVMGRWSLFDPLANQFFHLSHVGYASAWDVMNRHAIVDGHPEHNYKPTIDSSFYRVVAIAELPPTSR